MKKYEALTIISGIIKYFGYIVLCLSVIPLFAIFGDDFNLFPGLSILFAILMIPAFLITGVLIIAISEFIDLFIDIARNVEAIKIAKQDNSNQDTLSGSSQKQPSNQED